MKYPSAVHSRVNVCVFQQMSIIAGLNTHLSLHISVFSPLLMLSFQINFPYY